MDNPTREENFIEPLITNNKDFKTAITFLTGYNGNFNITEIDNKFYCITPEKIIVDIVLEKGAYELEAMDLEIKRLMVLNGDSDGETIPITIKQDFSTQGSIMEIIDRWGIYFTFDSTTRTILGADARVISGKYNLSDHQVDIISFDNIFIECDIAKGMHAFASLHVFDKFYQLGHNIPIFEGSINVNSFTSTENSFLGFPYEKYTFLNTNACSLQLTPSAFNMRPGKSYILRLFVRGVGNSIRKNLEYGVYKEQNTDKLLHNLTNDRNFLETGQTACCKNAEKLFLFRY